MNERARSTQFSWIKSAKQRESVRLRTAIKPTISMIEQNRNTHRKTQRAEQSKEENYKQASSSENQSNPPGSSVTLPHVLVDVEAYLLKTYLMSASTHLTTVFVTGDFNTNSLNKSDNQRLHDLLGSYNLTPRVNSPTRVSPNCSSILDQVFTNSSNDEEVSEPTKQLGVVLDSRLNCQPHIEQLCSRLSSQVFALRQLSPVLPKQTLREVYFGIIHSHICYGILLGVVRLCSTVFILKKRAVRVLDGIQQDVSCRESFKKFNTLPLPCIFILECLVSTHRNCNSLLRHSDIHNYNTQRAGNLVSTYSRLDITAKKQATYFFAEAAQNLSCVLVVNDSILWQSLLEAVRCYSAPREGLQRGKKDRKREERGTVGSLLSVLISSEVHVLSSVYHKTAGYQMSQFCRSAQGRI
nr:unnamed protein product [Callosobruchus analis]